MTPPHSSLTALRAVFGAVALARLREQPGRLLVTLMAIALGVALATAVHLVNSGALAEFGQATRRLVGEADLVIRGPRAGFDENLYPRIARLPGVEAASPLLELEVVPVGAQPLKVLALDPLRAATLQPSLLAELAGSAFDLLEPDAIALSASAAAALGIKAGDRFEVRAGTDTRRLRVVRVLSEGAFAQRLGIMDIASAQWLFGRVGDINRLDLRLTAGTRADAFRSTLAGELPPGVLVVTPELEVDRAAGVTRAYRVNLNMLALVSLLTGAFLVFSTQALSVLRRRTALGLLRAIGVTRGQLTAALVAEGALLGALGSAAGVALGWIVADGVLRKLGGDLGGGYFDVTAQGLRLEPGPLAVFWLIGTAVATLGAWVPAREAAARPPARALKAGDAEAELAHLAVPRAGIVSLALGALAALAPPVGGLPVFGYVSVTLLLLAAVLFVPAVSSRVLARVPRSGRVTWDTAVAQLAGSAGQAAVSLATIIVSVSLMVAMAIMVFSFRESFDQWLSRLLPADLQMRVAVSSDTAYWSTADQAAALAVPGVARIEFRRVQPIYLAPDRAPPVVIARPIDPSNAGGRLPLVASVSGVLPDGAQPVWVSEAIVDVYGRSPGAVFDLPLAGRVQRVVVAGVWRDYAHAEGAVVVDRDWYRRVTGDDTASEGSVWTVPGADAEVVADALRQRFPRGEELKLFTSAGLRELSLSIFDRAFAITYALEAVAVLVGLVGVSFAFSSQALARRAEFGMLRHVGLLRSQVRRMLAVEGVLLSLVGVVYGLLTGGVLSLVLVYVINRQSFNWSIDLAVPWWQLAALAVTLVAAAAVTATLSGRAALGTDALRAVREDW